MTHHLAQVNIARMRAPLDDPIMADFVDNLDRINGLGASQPGFVWIMQDGDEHGGNTDVAFFGDPGLISNLTVWEDVESLSDFTLRTEHKEFLRRRREWFEPMDEAFVALWWVPAWHRPTIAEAERRVRHLRVHGPTREAFTFRAAFPAPAPVSPQARLRFDLTDPTDDDARSSLGAYFAELDERFDEGFDASGVAEADAPHLRAPTGAFVVLHLDGEAVGCGGLATLEDGVGEIRRMWLHDRLRGSGIGKRLVNHLEHLARQHGHHTVRLDNNVVLTSSMGLYRDLGYAEIPRYNDNPHAGHWFEKRL